MNENFVISQVSEIFFLKEDHSTKCYLSAKAKVFCLFMEEFL